MIKLRPKTPAEIDRMREGGRLLSDILHRTYDFVTVGKVLLEIDQFIHTLILQSGAVPSFLGYRGYPAASCLSVNDVVVHGIPSSYCLKPGDLLGVDVGILWQDFHTDAAFTKGLGPLSIDKQQLLRVTQTALKVGVEAAIQGNVVGDIGRAIATFVESQGSYGIIRDLTGHGVGQKLQEPPEIANYNLPNNTPLVNGLTLAIEPMISLGDWCVAIDKDEWTVRTKDHSPAAHFETTICIAHNDPEILVSFPLETFSVGVEK